MSFERTVQPLKAPLLLVFAARTTAPALALGQACPDVPADYRPHVSVYPSETLSADGHFSMAVHFSLVHCTTSRAPVPPVLPAHLTVTITEGNQVGSVLSLTGRGSNLGLRLPSAGTYTLTFASTLHRHLVPAAVRVRVMESQPRQRVQIRAVSSASPRPLNALKILDEQGFYRYSRPRTINDRGRRKEYVSVISSIVPGVYSVQWVTDHGPELRQSLTVTQPRGPQARSQQSAVLEFSR